MTTAEIARSHPPGQVAHFMIAFVRDRFVSSDQAVVSVFDRGLLYGDGLFETLRVSRGRPLFLEGHWERLARSAHVLSIPLRRTRDEIHAIVRRLIRENQATEAVVRVQLTRGPGPRGYSPRGARRPCWIITLHELPVPPDEVPSPWRLITASFPLASAPTINRHKSCSRLSYVVARAEADQQGARDALFLTRDGWVCETTSANIFCLIQDRLLTPPIDLGILPGVTRRIVIEAGRERGLELQETRFSRSDLLASQAVFLTLSTLGVVEVHEIDRKAIPSHPLTKTVRDAYHEYVRQDLNR